MIQSMDIQIEIESNPHPQQEQVSSVDLNKDSNLIENPLDSENVSVDDENGSVNESGEDILHPSAKTTLTHIEFISATFLLIVISGTVGVIVVCLTSPNPNKTCQLTFKQTVDSSLSFDSRPRSLALGDFNQDNILDIVVGDSAADNINIFFQDKNGTFVNQTSYSTGSGSQPYSVAVGDFNKDNFLDIVVANYGTNSIVLFLGKGNTTFSNRIISTGSSRPLFITVADFNNDSNQDIAIVNYGTNDIGIVLGYGNGTFTNVTTYSTGFDSLPYSLAVGDFNNDKRLDIVVANYGTDDIAIFVGYGNGSFILSIRYTTTSGSNPISIAVADFDDDYVLDIVVANSGMNNIGIFFGYGNGSFAEQIKYSFNNISRPHYVTVGDLNQDRHVDIIILDTINSYGYMLPGYGNGTFSDLTIYTGTDQVYPYAALISDFNNDNRSDVAVVNYGTNRLAILTGYSSRHSALQTQYSVGHDSHPQSIALGDFNSDQSIDIVVAKYTADSIGVLLGYGNGSFATEISYSVGTGSAPQCVSIGDFNNDNQTDLAVANYGSDAVGILLNSGNGSFSSLITYSTGNDSFPIFVAVGDFNDNHALDIVAVNFLSDDVAIFLGYGNGSFAKAVAYSTGDDSDPTAIVVADFNNDTQLDLAVSNSETSNVGILFGNGDGTFKIVITYSTGFQSHPDSIVAGDLNNDHWLDIVVADSSSDYVAILLGYKNGTFGGAVMYTDDSMSNPSGLALGDVNDDNNIDMIVTNLGAGTVDVLYGYGNGSFSLDISLSLKAGSGPKGVIIEDFDNDSRWDIVIAESGFGNVNVLVRYIEALFADPVVYSVGSGAHPEAVLVADFNNDNRSDIATAESGSDDVGVLLGYGNGSFAPQTTYFVGLNSRPQYLIAGDFNQDNQLDIATVNTYNDSISVLVGSSNGSFSDTVVYSTDEDSEPYWIATGDFNDDHRIDFIVANQGRDSIGILLGYHYGTFNDQETYSNQYSLRPSSVISYDFNNDTYQDIAATFAGNDSIGILFGYGNGTFAELIMYSVGYNSYPTEIIGVDVNNDNILDIIVANTGSSTLGVLLGYGNGIFAPVMIFSTGNDSTPYGAAPGDFNSDTYMDIVVANYHSNTIGVLLGYGDGKFAPVVLYSLESDSRPQSVAVDDFNQDSILDIVVANYRRDDVGLFLGNGDGTFQSETTFSTGYNAMPTFIITNDFNNDSKMDVAVSNKNNDNVGILFGYGNGTFAPIVIYETGPGTSPQCIRSNDLNNDEAIDIVIASPGTNTIMVLYGLGDGRFLLGPSFSTGSKSGPISMDVGDFNRDGKLDITTANYLGNNIGVHISYGTVHFGGAITYSTGVNSEPNSVAVSDFNNDGKSDVAVANYGTNNLGIFLGYGNVSFTSMVTYSMGDSSGPVAVAVADVSYDNQSDVVVVNSEANNVCVLLGDGNGSFTIVSTISTGYRSLPYGVTIGDFNKDKIVDIVIVTAGTSSLILARGYGNGTYGNELTYEMGYNFDIHAVALGDFNGDGLVDITIANYGGDYVDVLLQTC